MYFFISSKLLPYNCIIFSNIWSSVSNSFKAPVVKNREIKFVLCLSYVSAISYNLVMYLTNTSFSVTMFHSSAVGQVSVDVTCVNLP